MSFIRPTLSEIIERARADYEARLPGADSRLRRSFLDVLARVQSGAASNLYGYLDWIARQILPDTAEAEYLARHASIWGMARKAATAAVGTVDATGSDGVDIPSGTVLTRVDGARFLTTADATVAGGTAALAVEAEASGPDGNTEAARQLTFVSPIAGVQAAALVAAGGLAGGADEESDTDLLARLLQRIRNQPQGGALADYERWALEVDEVTRAWVYPLYLGEGTVGVTFVMDGRPDIIPLTADVDAVQAHIDTLRPVTAAVTAFAPIPYDVDMLIAVSPSTAEVKAAVEEELADLFTRDSVPGGTIYLSRIREAISIAAGEDNHVLHLPSADIISPAGNLARLGTVSWIG